jgi:prepilin-type processing-associated H-X9-DG protein
LGLPLTTWAFAYYLSLAALLLIAHLVRGPYAGLLAPALSSTGVVTAAWLIFVMTTRLDEYCPWCLALHGVNLAFFILAVVEACNQFQAETSRRQVAALSPVDRRPALIAAGVALLFQAGQVAALVFHNDHRALDVVMIRGVLRPLEEVGLNRASGDDEIFTIKGDPDKLISPILFVDGHVQQCDFTPIMKRNLVRGLEPGKDWMWYKPLK